MQTAYSDVIGKLNLEDGSERKEELCQENSLEESVVSFQEQLPLTLQAAMKGFIEQYPNWDQYRLIQAALSGFLVQNGVDSRSITRLYLANMFSSASFKELTE